MKKRITAALLVLALFLSLVPTAFAANGDAKIGDFTAVDGDSACFVGVKADGTVWLWADYGAEGSPIAEQYYKGRMPKKPTQLPGFSNIVSVVNGGSFILGLDASGGLWTFGRNEWGELLTDGYFVSTPKRIMTGVSAVTAGSGHIMVIKSDKSLWS